MTCGMIWEFQFQVIIQIVAEDFRVQITKILCTHRSNSSVDSLISYLPLDILMPSDDDICICIGLCVIFLLFFFFLFKCCNVVQCLTFKLPSFLFFYLLKQIPDSNKIVILLFLYLIQCTAKNFVCFQFPTLRHFRYISNVSYSHE